MLKQNQFPSNPNEHSELQKFNDEQKAEKYLSDYRLLDIRCGVLEEERNECEVKIYEVKSKVRDKEASLTTLSIEKEDCLNRLKKVQRELELINSFQDTTEQEITDLKKESKK